MSDRMCCTIRVGGGITLQQLSELSEMEEWDDKTLIEFTQQPGDSTAEIELQLFAAPYGQLDTVENWLMEEGLPFDRSSDGQYEHPYLVRVYRPGNPAIDEVFMTDIDGEVTVTRNDLVEIVASALGQATPEERWSVLMKELTTKVGLEIPTLEYPYIRYSEMTEGSNLL